MDTVMRRLLSTVRIGTPRRMQALTLLPVFADVPPGPDYVTLAEALATPAMGVAVVMDGVGVLVRNRGRRAILALAGETLRCDDRPWVLGATALVPRDADVALPLRGAGGGSASVRGRWARDGSAGSASRVRCCDGQKGLIAVSGGQVLGFDLVSRSAVYATLHDGMVRGYVLEARRRGGHISEADATLAKAFVADLGALSTTAYGPSGMTSAHSYTGMQITGSALSYRTWLVQGSFQPRFGCSDQQATA